VTTSGTKENAAVQDGTVTASNALTRLLRLQQITGGFAKDENGHLHEVDYAKSELLRDVLEDLDTHEPLVIFCTFHPDLDRCRRVALETGRSVAELSGRLDELEAWQQGGADVLVAQIQSGKEGVDLTRAAYTIYYSGGYSLGDYDQSLSRTHRPGQTRQTTYIHLALEDTVDLVVYQALHARQEVITAVLDASARRQMPYSLVPSSLDMGSFSPHARDRTSPSIPY
jgi:SNF2 family DNA or RNA helicase